MANPRTLGEWTFLPRIGTAGLELHDVVHEHELMARRVGLIRCYSQVSVPDSNYPRFSPFTLSSASRTRGEDFSVEAGPARTPDFHYTMRHQLRAPFMIPNLGGSNETIYGSQIFAFTDASDTPRHETGKITKAARFYPTVEFYMDEVEDQTQGSVEFLRFDYWIETAVAAGGRRKPMGGDGEDGLARMAFDLVAKEPLDFVLDEVIRHYQSMSAYDPKAMRRPQQAGLFCDREDGFLTRAYHSAEGPSSPIFDAAEKPLRWEVAGKGIINGQTSGCWENIHVWGESPVGLVSTPGMPFGFHLHWRWAAALTDAPSSVFGAYTPSSWVQPELAGIGLKGEPIPGGPLIDPRLPSTDLEIAVVRKSTAELFAAASPRDCFDFAAIFERLSPRPQPIETNEELVIIMSIVVRRPEPHKAWGGLIFPHGIFFPHGEDAGVFPELGLAWLDAYQPQYIPADKPPQQEWRRSPK